MGLSLLRPLTMAFYSKPLYREVARRWTTASALVYLFVLLALAWAVTIAKMHADLVGFADADGRLVIEQIPELSLEHGELSAPEARPYTVKDPHSGDRIAIIDTSGATTSFPDSETYVLVTRTQVLARRDPWEARTFEVADLARDTGADHLVITHERLRAWLDLAVRWLPLVLFPLALVGSYLYRLVSAAALGFVGLALARRRGVPLSYAACVRLACVAITPLVIAQTVLTLLDDSVGPVIGFVIAVGYLYFGVDANAESERLGPADLPRDLAAQ